MPRRLATSLALWRLWLAFVNNPCSYLGRDTNYIHAYRSFSPNIRRKTFKYTTIDFTDSDQPFLQDSATYKYTVVMKSRKKPPQSMQTFQLRNAARTGSLGRVQLKCDGTRWRTGGEVNEKLANGVGSQYPSHYLGTWCIQHYYRSCAHLGCQ